MSTHDYAPLPATQPADHHALSVRQETPPAIALTSSAPIPEATIDLREYIEVILRRKWTVITFLLVTFFSVAILSFSMTPFFKADGHIKVTEKGMKVTKFDDMTEGISKSQEFQATQVQVLKSNRLIDKTITMMALADHPAFHQQDEKTTGFSGQVKTLLSRLKNIIRPTEKVINPDTEKALLAHHLQETLITKFKKNLSVSPVRNTQLIKVSFQSPDAQLAADIVNGLLKSFLDAQVEGKLETFYSANTFLQKQIESAKIQLERSENQLNEFARQSGIISMGPKLNLTLRQLEEVNEALSKAVTVRVYRETTYRQALKENGNFLPQVLSNLLIQRLKEQQATLLAEYQDLQITFKADYPKVKQLKARLDDLEQRTQQEIQQIILSLKNNYEAALANEVQLQEKAASQKKLAMALNERSTQYRILLREVDTNKDIYKSLLERSKEIEATIGADIGNFEVIDPARMAVAPFKPRILLNLLLAIIGGLFGGILIVLILEQLDNTVKTTEELIHRLHIPVLGLIPYDTHNSEDPEDSTHSADDKYHTGRAFRSYYDPRAALSEAIRTAMTSVKLSSAGHPPRSILITSVRPDAGKSTIACNFSLSLLPDSQRIIIIDADIRKPALHKLFGRRKEENGLSTFLTGNAGLDEIIYPSKFEKFFFIPSGPVPPNPAELLASKKMRLLIKELGEQFDHIIIDAPPFHGFAEILVLSNMVDGVILVSELNKTPREGVKYFRKAVSSVGGNILGTLVNKVSASGRRYSAYGSYGSYGGYQYDYSYGRES